MRKVTVQLTGYGSPSEAEIDDSMVVEPGDYIPRGDYNPHNVHPWVIGAEFGPFAVVFASDAGTALDIAADSGKMDFLMVSEEDLENDYPTDEDREDLLTAGSASEYFYQDYLWMGELENPPFSFVALLS